MIYVVLVGIRGFGEVFARQIRESAPDTRWPLVRLPAGSAGPEHY